ncbi:major pollen allergen Ole e 10-like [Pistacia vera]|uniref:major pollen allergen Ole e 10-like n=1 Tax=Pistacia vera TaxID=55513 RepID=UPI00126357CC|nr:major pollen allergen Ole e 10-like [Pistacia vera]
MNAFYQASGRQKFDCDFKSSALIALTDPSSSSCTYPGAEADVDTSNTWCVAKPTANDNILQSNIDFACQKTNCDPIKEGGLCFNPNTLMHHASYAMNSYYQLSGRDAASCDFNNSAMIVTSNPGYGTGCYYASALPLQI